mmetsp:Transcript_11455/g.23996  ORF Transcript_11455/g.23996 Transcript_11455/m.23996 type:complete len:216 (-) Transcript_11455:88-735(-)
MVTTTSEITLVGISAADVGSAERAIIKEAISESTGVDEDEIYNLEVTDATRRLIGVVHDEALHGRRADDSSALVTFDVIIDLLLTNYTTSGQLANSIEELVTEAVESGDLTTAIETLAASEGNTVMTSVSATVIASQSYTTTEADVVTSAPTALYSRCGPLWMTPNELATYMDGTLCQEEEGDYLGPEACAIISDMTSGNFPAERCSLTTDPLGT